MAACAAARDAAVAEGGPGRVRCPPRAVGEWLDAGAVVAALREPQGPHHQSRHPHHKRRASAAVLPGFLCVTDENPQNIKLRLASLPPPRGTPAYDLTISSAPQAPTLVIPQLTAVRTSINSCLDVIDVATWGGDATRADFVAGQLQLLHEHVQEARQALKGYSDVQLPWWEHPVDEQVGRPQSHGRTER